nr:MAG TPA: hypothetical protein [Caudoviricetes sp.]
MHSHKGRTFVTAFREQTAKNQRNRAKQSRKD